MLDTRDPKDIRNYFPASMIDAWKDVGFLKDDRPEESLELAPPQGERGVWVRKFSHLLEAYAIAMGGDGRVHPEAREATDALLTHVKGLVNQSFGEAA
jgi:hypothetical protein